MRDWTDPTAIYVRGAGTALHCLRCFREAVTTAARVWGTFAAALGAPGRGGEGGAEATRDIVVIGSSAGGIQALVELVSLLPARLPAALVMVVHTRSTAPSALPSILSKAGPLPASHPEQGTPITHGQNYVARPDHHLLVREGRIALSRAPKENGHRPAVNALFQSAAQEFGRRMVLPSTNRRGKSFECVVTCLPLWRPQKDKAQGAILIMEDLGSAVQS